MEPILITAKSDYLYLILFKDKTPVVATAYKKHAIRNVRRIRTAELRIRILKKKLDFFFLNATEEKSGIRIWIRTNNNWFSSLGSNPESRHL